MEKMRKPVQRKSYKELGGPFKRVKRLSSSNIVTLRHLSATYLLSIASKCAKNCAKNTKIEYYIPRIYSAVGTINK